MNLKITDSLISFTVCNRVPGFHNERDKSKVSCICKLFSKAFTHGTWLVWAFTSTIHSNSLCFTSEVGRHIEKSPFSSAPACFLSSGSCLQHPIKALSQMLYLLFPFYLKPVFLKASQMMDLLLQSSLLPLQLWRSRALFQLQHKEKRTTAEKWSFLQETIQFREETYHCPQTPAEQQHNGAAPRGSLPWLRIAAQHQEQKVSRRSFSRSPRAIKQQSRREAELAAGGGEGWQCHFASVD